MKGKNNRWENSEEFMNTSFADCVDPEKPWKGFRSIKYTSRLIKKITNQFPVVRYIKSSTDLRDFSGIDSICGLYIISDSEKTLLKVGQTVNPYGRFAAYYSLSKNKPIRYDLFSVENYELQNLYEDKIRNFMEYLGYMMPSDNTGKRLEQIESIL